MKDKATTLEQVVENELNVSLSKKLSDYSSPYDAVQALLRQERLVSDYFNEEAKRRLLEENQKLKSFIVRSCKDSENFEQQLNDVAQMLNEFLEYPLGKIPHSQKNQEEAKSI